MCRCPLLMGHALNETTTQTEYQAGPRQGQGEVGTHNESKHSNTTTRTHEDLLLITATVGEINLWVLVHAESP